MRMAPATRWGSRRATGRCHLGGSTAAARTIGGGASVLGGGGAALGGQLITQADVFMWRCLLPWRASRSVLKAGALTLDPQATCSLHSARPLSNRPQPALEPAFSFVSYLTPDGSSQGCTDRQFTSTCQLETDGFALCSADRVRAGGSPGKGKGPDLPVFRGEDDRDTRSCQLCFLPRELLFSVSCAENKRPCDRSGQQCPAQGGPGPAPVRPSLGYLLRPHPHHLSRVSPPTPSRAGRKSGKSQPSRPCLLALAGPPSWLREAGQPSGRYSYQPPQRW